MTKWQILAFMLVIGLPMHLLIATWLGACDGWTNFLAEWKALIKLKT